MEKKWIKNFDELTVTENRKNALKIASVGFDAINTREVVKNKVKLENNILTIMGESVDLAKFKRVKIVGFGKDSCDAALALEKIFGDRITHGVVIGIQKVICSYIETFAGTHPRPSEINIEAGKKIYETIDQSNEDDLIIVVVSGGGSALLCPTESECEQGIKLYDSSLKHGHTITEMNTVRKHLSVLKGGGLAKVAYPATIIGLIFSDVPGDNFNEVASGPTYEDRSTIRDAEKIIEKYDFGQFNLIETPKEGKYFEKVRNFVLVSNKTAVEAMAEKGKELGFKTKIVSTELYDEVDEAIKKIFSAKEDNTVVLVAGEPRIEVTNKGGKGGRSLHMGLKAIKMKVIDKDCVFIPFASDGMDNSDVAGAVIDQNTLKKVEELELDVDDYLGRFDSYTFFQKTGDMIITGPTGSNVSDLMILLTKK